jgi:cation transport ATPase
LARHFRLMVFFGYRDIWLVGWLPMLVGLAMAMSSVTVVGNSILLGRYIPKFAARQEGTREK